MTVALNCRSFPAQAVGYLHDILEDTDTRVENLLEAGIPPKRGD